MNDESVLGLMRELTMQLSATAEDYRSRVARFDRVEPDAAPDAAELRSRARRLIAERKLRRTYLPPELFHEPAWDMLLALFLAYDQARPMNVKALVLTADAPVTTAQRWIDHLARMGLIDRVTDPNDRRRVELSLNDAGHAAIAEYLAALL